MKRALSAILIITMLLSTVALAVPQAVTIGDSVEEEFLGPEDSYGELSGDNYTNLDYFKSVTLTGDMATDIANVAYAQVGKTYYDLGYDEIGATYWCARFVSDCARIAGVPLNVIGKTAGASAASFGLTKNQIIDKSNAKNGDLVFWVCNHSDCSDAPNWHVGIYYNGKVVSGSNGSNPSNVRYYSDSSYTHGNSAHNSYIEAVYYRPNYTSNATKRIEELKELFPSGSYFSVDGKACNHTSKETCSNCNLVNVLKRDDLKDYRFSDGGSWTCLGFAKFAWYFIHGKVWSESYDVIINKGTPNKDFFNQAVPGDMVYFFDSSDSFRHAAIFVSASDTSAEVYHANTGGVPNKVSCGSWSYSSMSSNYGSGSYARLLRIKGYVPDDDIWSPNTLPLTVNGSHVLINAISTGGEMAYYEFTPTQSGKYTIYSTDTTDTQVYLYDEDGNELAFDDDSGEGQNFSLTYDLTAGTKYIYGIKFYDSTETGDLRFTFGRYVYNVNYNANGGSGAPNSQSKLYGTDLILSSTVPTRDGYTFKGWATSANGSVAYASGATYTVNSAITLYAVWQANTYTVKYNANGGSGSTANSSHTYDVSRSLRTNGFTKAGHYFLGWSTNSSATSATYTNGQNVKNLTATNGATVNLYAVWGKNSYNVFCYAEDDNGASRLFNAFNGKYGEYVTIPDKIPTRTGYTFLGWSSSEGDTSPEYVIGDSYLVLDASPLYAVWQTKKYTISFDANGGSGAPENERKVHDINHKLSSTIPTRNGYTFLGWSTTKNGSVVYTAGDTYTTNSAVTLYAVWQADKYTILYHPNGGTNIPENQTKLHGVPLATSELSPTREGFSFNAWYNYDRKTYLTPGSEYDRDAHIELYPIWVADGKNDFEIEFTSDETYENYHHWSGYESDKNVTREIDEEEKALVVTAKEVTGAPDPAIEFRYLHFKAEDYPVIIVNAKMEIDSMDNNLMQMFFTSANQEVTEAKSVKVRFNPANEDGYRDFVFDMTENEAWSNIITRLRLDPFNACEGKCSIKSIRFVAKVPVTGVALDKTSATMDAGDTLNLTATVNPADATNKNVTWTSSDTSVATVENGVVTAKSAGTATITATTVDGGKTATCTVTVTSEPFDETEYVATGYCGDNIIWVLDNEGTLTISGTGKMWDEEYGYHSWNDYRSQIFKVVVEDGVTYIGGQAFGWCENLSDVQLPETVTGLGYDAFYSCSSLIEIKLPSKLKTIGQGAFGWCEALVTIDIPDSVTSIGKEAFYICNSLVSVSVPDGVTNIGNSTFEGCHNIRKIKIGSGVTSIGDYAFKDCFKLKNVTIPDGVVSIRLAAFEYCESLEVITIPESVISIEEAAFNGCENLTIYGYADSEAESYANENGIPFELVGSEENIHVTGVTLNKTATTLKIGEEETLTATVAPEKATNKNVIWTSSDESVATVKNGVVTVIGPGSAIITVTTEDGGFTDECCVEGWKQYTICYNANSGTGAPADQTKTHDIDIVLSSKTPRRAGYIFKGWATERYSDIVEYYAGENYADNTDLYLYAVWERVVSATKVTLNKTKASMAIGGDDLYLEATMTPADSTDTLTWSVDKPEIATVDENGVVTAHATGKVKVTAVAGSGKKATCSITVGEPATKVEFSSLKSTSLAVGKTLTLKAKASRDDKVKPVSTNVVYEIIEGEEYATIDAKGKLKGVATGEVVIRARAEAGTEDAYAEVTINVCIPATKVKLNMTKASMAIGGEDLYLSADISPENHTDTLTWSVDKPEIAEVDENGVVTAYAAGKVKVTATTGSGKKATCTVTVGEPATKVEFTSLKATSLAVGKTLSLKAKASRDDKVKPVSTNVVYEIIEGEEYATIDAKGKLKGVATGEVVVRAWAEAGTEDAYADVTINVCIPATKVKLNMTKATVSVGDELQLEADITPVDNTDTLTWISANEDIATVDEDGLVTVHEEGKVKITAVTGSGKKATCTVTVTE